MPNMSYCRFENTVKDLQDCYDNMEDRDLSEYEFKAREQLIDLCRDIVNEYGRYDFEAEDDGGNEDAWRKD